jgi:CubicO group peptidase (beta-lactamase class C family)
MTSTSYVWRPTFDSVTATGHDENGAPTDKWKPDEAGAASTLNTTAKDYALFVEGILNRKGLKPATFHEMETPQIPLDPTCRICIKQEPKQLSQILFWGLGWGIQRNSADDRNQYLWHWGDNGSFKAFVMLNPKSKSAIVLFANSSNGLALAEPIVNQAMAITSPAFTWLK